MEGEEDSVQENDLESCEAENVENDCDKMSEDQEHSWDRNVGNDDETMLKNIMH